MGVLKSMDFVAPGAPLRVGELPRRVLHPQSKRSNGSDALFDIARLFFPAATWHPPRAAVPAAARHRPPCARPRAVRDKPRLCGYLRRALYAPA